MKQTKLVRDLIDTIAAERGQHLDTYIASPHERRSRLRDKPLGEAAEAEAATPRELLDELADVTEVVRALAAEHGWTPEDIEKARQAKAAHRSGFTRGLILRQTTE